MKRMITTLLLALLGFSALCACGATLLVRLSASGRTYSDIDLIPRRHVGLVLGCSRLLSDGQPNAYFINRSAAAARLLLAGKVDILLASGETLPGGYDEAADMRASLLDAGVPSEKKFCDHEGSRTLDSVVRASGIYGQTTLAVISQAFHNRRAIFIATHRGVDAIVFNAGHLVAAPCKESRDRTVAAAQVQNALGPDSSNPCLQHRREKAPRPVK